MNLKQNALARIALLTLAAGSLGSTALMAGTLDKTPSPVTEAPEEPFVTGNLTALVQTHFISYGGDGWGIGNSWKDALFHPSMELDFHLGGGFQAYINTWWDVNSLGVTNIGSEIQEIDVNAGFLYKSGDWNWKLGYGAWNYASQTQSVVDFKVSHADTLNPFFAIHGRVDDGFAAAKIPFARGAVGQIGIAPGCPLGPITLSMPVTLSVETKGYHGGDGGFAYASAGLTATIPLTKHVSAIIGATYYHTDAAVIPYNPTENFVMGTAGLTVVF